MMGLFTLPRPNSDMKSNFLALIGLQDCKGQQRDRQKTDR